MLKLKHSCMEASTLFSKYKGAAFGALVGDCIGAECEGVWSIVSLELDELITMDAKFFKKYEKGLDKSALRYSIDTLMAHILAQSLMLDQGFDPSNLASRYAETFFVVGHSRGIGGSVMRVFEKLRKRNYSSDPYLAAKEQFEGRGSYGNGSAMRVFPVGLYYHKQPKEIEKIASLSAQITHSHIEAVNGAILQAMAVETALLCNSTEPCIWEKFWETLKDLVDRLEMDLDDRPYTKRLDYMHKALREKVCPSKEDLKENIGNGVRAVEAVSEAIFCFLCCLADLQPAGLNSFTKPQQTILFAISLGGDTNTIATMAGAIAGAYYGCDMVPEYWMFACEGHDVALKIAKDLYDVVSRRISP